MSEPAIDPTPFQETYIGRKEFTDFTIFCGNHAFRVHKIMLISQCVFFEKALTGGFQEATTDSMNLDDEDPWMLKLFLQILYRTDSSEQKLMDDFDAEWTSVGLARLYAIADRFQKLDLKSTIAKVFGQVWESDNQVLDGDDCCDTISIVYTSTPDTDSTLRDLIPKPLSGVTDWVEDPADHVLTLLREHPDFAAEMIRYDAKEIRRLRSCVHESKRFP